MEPFHTHRKFTARPILNAQMPEIEPPLYATVEVVSCICLYGVLCIINVLDLAFHTFQLISGKVPQVGN